MRFSRWVRVVMALLHALAVTACVVSAMVLTGLRVYLPELANNKATVEAWVSAQVERPVTIERLWAGVVGVTPSVRLSGIKLMSADGARVLVDLKELRIDLAWWRSLRRGTPELALLVMRGATLDISRSDRGRWSLGGMEYAQAEGDDDLALPLWLARQDRVIVESARIRLRDRLQPANDMDIGNLDLWLTGGDTNPRVIGQASARGGVAGSLRFGATLIGGQSLDWARPTGVVYLDASGIDFSHLRFTAVERLQGRGAAAGWLYLTDGRLERLRGNARLARLTLPANARRQVVDIDAISGDLDWRKRSDGWDAAVTSLRIDKQTGSWRARRLQLATDATAGTLAVAGTYLDLSDAVRFFSALPSTDEKRVSQLSSLAPKGAVRDFYFRYRPATEAAPADWTLTGDISDLAVSAYEGIPRVQGIAGQVAFDSTAGGTVTLDTASGRFWMPEAFRGVVEFGSLSGQLRVGRVQDRWSVVADRIEVRNPDFDVVLRFETIDGQQPRPWLMIADIKRFDVGALGRYLPVRRMPVGGFNWLDNALVAGEATGRLLMRGVPGKFPFQDGDGRWAALLQVQNAVLDYVPGGTWPRIEALQASLSTDGPALRIEGRQGRILNSRITRVQADIPDLMAQPKQLQIASRIESSVVDVLDLLRTSPLASKVGKPFERWQGSGVIDIDLNLGITIGKPTKVFTQGLARFVDAELDMVNAGLQAHEVRGELAFGTDGASAPALTSNLVGGPATIEIATDRTPTGMQTVINAQGTAKTSALTRYLGLGPERIFSGETGWRSQVRIAGTDVVVNFASDLIGAGILAPTPLGKPEAQALPLDVTVKCDCVETPRLRANFALADLAKGELEVVSSEGVRRVSRGAIAVRGAPAMPESGFLLGGSIPPIDLSEWRNWMRDLSDGGSAPAAFDRVEARFERVAWLGQEFSNLGVLARRQQNGWIADLDGPQVRGRAELDNAPDRGKATLNLDYLRWARNRVGGPGKRVQPGRVPDISMSIGDLFYENRLLGKVSMTATGQGDGLLVDALSLRRRGTLVEGSLRWMGDTTGESTSAKLEAQTSDLGELVEMVGSRELVGGGDGKLGVNLVWPGAPNDYSLGKATGQIRADVKDGSILGVEPGLGRLFGILSLQSVERRLSLNFKDVVGEGMVFDKLVARLDLEAGAGDLARFEMDGPASKVAVTGRLNPANRSLDLLATSVPKLTSSLPVAGAIGSLGVGAAIYLGQKLLEPQIRQFTLDRYRITGTWEDPVITKLPRERRSVGNAPESLSKD